MQRSSKNLYGNVPDVSPVVLLLIDVINDLDFPEGPALLRHALPMARRLFRLKQQAKRRGAAVIYVNDNFGRWRSDFKSQVNHCLRNGVAGRKIAELLKPGENDYFVLKPAHSGFYSTTLDLLLKHLGATTVILTGIATNICVLFTANDAYLRGYRIVVPRDCVAANTARLTKEALTYMNTVLKADISPSRLLRWSKFRESPESTNRSQPRGK